LGSIDDSEDAFGLMLRDHLRGKAGGAILEVDGGSSEPALAATVFFSSYEQWAEAEREALKEVRGRILDIGCGAGRHALYFQERGHEVVAVDISLGAVEVRVAEPLAPGTRRDSTTHGLGR